MDSGDVRSTNAAKSTATSVDNDAEPAELATLVHIVAGSAKDIAAESHTAVASAAAHDVTIASSPAIERE
jgi:hypothetical protein